jgi:hypothetical protein
MDTPTFTFQQLNDWERYEKVRTGGKWNMFSPQARAATGLDGERYAFCMTNYSTLKKVVEGSTIKPNT